MVWWVINLTTDKAVACLSAGDTKDLVSKSTGQIVVGNAGITVRGIPSLFGDWVGGWGPELLGLTANKGKRVLVFLYHLVPSIIYQQGGR